MSKLVYGRNGQVRFQSEQEKADAIDYLVNSSNVTLHHEDNQNQGAWGSEQRFHFEREEGIPESLKRNMTAGRGSMYGRINCKELYDEIKKLRG